jgi:hypothetical protein
VTVAYFNFAGGSPAAGHFSQLRRGQPGSWSLSLVRTRESNQRETAPTNRHCRGVPALLVRRGGCGTRLRHAGMAQAQTVLADIPAPDCAARRFVRGNPLRPVGLRLKRSRPKAGKALVVLLPCKPPSSAGMDGGVGEDCLSARHPLMTGASSAAAVHGEQRRETAPAAVCWGGLLFGSFLLAEQEKGTSRRATPGEFDLDVHERWRGHS